MVVLGAGGAARAVVVALTDAGCRDIVVANRTPARARAMLDALALDRSITVAGLDATLAGRLAEANLLVNATAVGWQGDALPLPAPLLDALAPGSLVYDLTYRETPLLQAAMRRGLPTLDGLPMLVHQGARSFQLWTGQEPPVALMLQAAQAARSGRTTTSGL